MNVYTLSRAPCYLLDENFDKPVNLGFASSLDVADEALFAAAISLSECVSARGIDSRVHRGHALWVVEIYGDVPESVEFECGCLN